MALFINKYLIKELVYLELKEVTYQKKHGAISITSIVLGMICFFIVFITPTRIANIGSLIFDYLTFFLTGVGMIISIVGIVKKREKNTLPIIGLILSSSFFIYWVIIIIMLFTGQIEFGP